MKTKIGALALFLLLLGGGYFFIFRTLVPKPEVIPTDWPLWDGIESIAAYAQKVGLPETITLFLPDKEPLHLNLIPAGRFQMGNPTPLPESPQIGAAIATLSGFLSVLLVVYAWVTTPNGVRFSLRVYILFIGLLSLLVFGVVRHQKAVNDYLEIDPSYTYAYNNQVFEQNRYWANAQPSHDCILSRPYYIGRYEITQDQYGVVTKLAPSTFVGTNFPVNNVTWFDAQAFCNKASEFLHCTVRLPTETEWEFACKTALSYQPPLDHVALEKICWYTAISNDQPHPVGTKAANVFGVYDMLGNVHEWCSDIYQENAYKYSPLVDPKGPTQGSARVARGGSWNSSNLRCNSTSRGDPNWEPNQQGFRVVVECDQYLGTP